MDPTGRLLATATARFAVLKFSSAAAATVRSSRPGLNISGSDYTGARFKSSTFRAPNRSGRSGDGFWPR